MRTITPAQFEKAEQLVEDGGIVADGEVYIAVSSDGSTIYIVNPVRDACSCPAGQVGRTCYHLVAAALLPEEAEEEAKTTAQLLAEADVVLAAWRADKDREDRDGITAADLRLADEHDEDLADGDELDADYALDRWEDLYA